MFIFFTSCGGQNKTDLPKEKIKSETKDASTSRWIYIKYEYTDSIGKSLIVQTEYVFNFCNLHLQQFRGWTFFKCPAERKAVVVSCNLSKLLK